MRELPGSWFRRRRKELRENVAGIAVALNVHPRSVENWERGTQVPSITKIDDLVFVYQSNRATILEAIDEIARSVHRVRGAA